MATIVDTSPQAQDIGKVILSRKSSEQGQLRQMSDHAASLLDVSGLALFRPKTFNAAPHSDVAREEIRRLIKFRNPCDHEQGFAVIEHACALKAEYGPIEGTSTTSESIKVTWRLLSQQSYTPKMNIARSVKVGRVRIHSALIIIL